MHVVSEDCLENIFESDHATLFKHAPDEKVTYLVPFAGKQIGPRTEVFEWLADNILQKKQELNYRQVQNWVRVDPLYIETEFK